MQRLMFLCLAATAACSTGPERPDPTEFPAATGNDEAESLLVQCDQIEADASFEADVTGGLVDSVEGVATYTYRTSPAPSTAITLRGCGLNDEADDEGRFISLIYTGEGRVPAGTYAVSRTFDEDGGFGFTFTDTRSAYETRCSDTPSGTVTITSSTFTRIEGEFNVAVGCLDTVGPLEGAVFTGAFAAENVGDE